MADAPFVCGLVLAAGGSSRLGQPKQLLPYRGATLLDAVLDTARASPFDQLVVALGGSAQEVSREADLSCFRVVVNESFGSGCSSSIAAALEVVDPECDVLVLMLGDQPGVTRETVRTLLDGRGDAPIAVCAYSDGRGHPFAFARSVFGELADLHGDKAVWKLLEQRTSDVVEVSVEGPAPRDVDTWQDYEAVVAAADQ
ncbi:MAG TPA: nucleotidyltransferase family protein [Thermoleophilaceae bacterium]|nr:nucleotidyltransferase family protein [Thermoleophilaceae bacterium]